MKDYAVVSLHEKGFWQVDVYWKMEQPPVEGDVPDHFKTFKIGQDLQAPLLWCHNWYPNAEVLIDDEQEDDEDEDDLSVTSGVREGAIAEMHAKGRTKAGNDIGGI